ncbi:MAG TPA: hypothetical protein VMU50_11640 [Polyangia bacterium]|nr:hypothetical protein [Polyangia bacterium]
MARSFRSLWWAVGVGLLAGACGAQSESGKANGSGTPATGGASGTGGATGSGGAGPGSGGAPASGGAGGGAAPADASSGDDATVDQPSGDGGPVAAAGCANNKYAACMDFETLPDAKWTGAGANVQTGAGKAAHGNAAFHGPPSTVVTTTDLGAITNVLWGRFYLHTTPKAPYGHGAIVQLYDGPNGNWYEVGFEYNGLQGNWHGPGGERYMRTSAPSADKGGLMGVSIPDKWVCVEFFADGANAAPVQIWMDGVLLPYVDSAKAPTILKTVKFGTFKIGLTPYHELSTVAYGGNAMPMTDMWIDDIALDTQRVGCIGN